MLPWNLVMRSGWFRIFALAAIAALFVNAQCYGNCLTVLDTPQAPSNSCHQHLPSQPDHAPCTHHHSEFSTLDSGIAKITLDTIQILPAGATQPSDAITPTQSLAKTDTGSPPPGRAGFSISIIRV